MSIDVRKVFLSSEVGKMLDRTGNHINKTALLMNMDETDMRKAGNIYLYSEKAIEALREKIKGINNHN